MEDMINKVNKDKSKKPINRSSGEINRTRVGQSIAERSLKHPEISKTVSPQLIDQFFKQFEEEETVNKKNLYIHN